MPTRPTVSLLFVFLLTMVGCVHVPRPYPLGQGPEPAELLEATQPEVDAIIVSDARMVANRFARGDLAFLAQAPRRFRGTVSKAGNELMTLAFHEEGYGLRYKMDAFPTGFYSGPPSSCVIQRLLGVPLAYEGLVATVLGGGPLIPGPHQILDQRWVRDEGHERLRIANATHIEELRFAWLAGRWVFAGATMWMREADGSGGRWLWSVDQEDLERVAEGVILPEETRIRAPGRRRDALIVIHYDSREFDPAFARTAEPQPTEPGPTGSGDGGEPPEGNDDAGWDDGGGWENDEDWENEPAESPEAEPEASEPPPPEEPPTPEPDPNPIPDVFQLDGTGLPDRGDLCGTQAARG